MSVRILHDTESDMAVIYDSVTETAFGPVIHPSSQCGMGTNAYDAAHAFLNDHLTRDARDYPADELVTLYADWKDDE